MKKPPPVCRIETCFHEQSDPDPDQLCPMHRHRRRTGWTPEQMFLPKNARRPEDAGTQCDRADDPPCSGAAIALLAGQNLCRSHYWMVYQQRRNAGT